MRYNPAGRDGHSNHDGGCWMRCDSTPVAKHTVNDTPSAMPSSAAMRVSWSLLVNLSFDLFAEPVHDLNWTNHRPSSS